jgi:recombination DNA repair RAD52 pathway protein
VKEAVTDGIKRCAKNLGMSMGLALYDKTQENVDEESNDTQAGAAQGPKPTAKQADKIAAPVAEEKRSSISENPPEDRDILIRTIGQMVEIATKLRKVTMADLKTRIRTNYKAEKKEELTNEQANEFYSYLRGVINA